MGGLTRKQAFGCRVWCRHEGDTPDNPGMKPKGMLLCAVAGVGLMAGGRGAAGDILDWRTGRVIPGTEGVPLQSGWTYFENAPYGDLRNADLTENRWHSGDLTHAKLSGANVTYASFQHVSLAGADFGGAVVNGTWFFPETGVTAWADRLDCQLRQSLTGIDHAAERRSEIVGLQRSRSARSVSWRLRSHWRLICRGANRGLLFA